MSAPYTGTAGDGVEMVDRPTSLGSRSGPPRPTAPPAAMTQEFSNHVSGAAAANQPSQPAPLARASRGGGGESRVDVRRGSNAKRHKRPQLRPGCARYGGQVNALIGKNLLLMRRHWVSTSIQILSPVAFIILVAIIDAAVRGGVTEDRHPVPFMTMADGNRHGEIPKCNVYDTSQGRYGLGNRIPGAWCNTLVYAPSTNAEVNSIMQEVARRRGFSFSSSGSASNSSAADVVGLSTEEDMREYLINFEGRAGFAVLFNQTLPGDAALPDKVLYEVWFNNTVPEWWIRKADADEGLEQANFVSDALRVQRAVDQAIIAVRVAAKHGVPVTTPALSVSLRKYPAVEPDDAGLSVVSTFLPLFIYCAVMTNFIIAMNQIVAEKETGMLAGMRSMGLMESAYWVSKVVEYFILSVLSTLLVCVAGIVTDLHVFVRTDFHVMFTAFFLYTMAMIAMAFAFASVINTTKAGNIASFLLFVVGMVVQIFNITGLGYLLFDPFIFSDTAIKLIQIYPPLDFAKIYADIDYVTRPTVEWDYDNLQQVIVDGGTYTWSTLDGGTYSEANQTSLTGDGTYHVPPTVDTFEWMAIVLAVFLVLAWYLGQVFTGGNGRARWPWFPFTPAFWGFSCEAFYKRPADLDQSGVDLRGLTKQFGLTKKFTAVNGLSLKMQSGKVFALLGHNGAGKTTAIKMITGHIAPTAGDAYVCGYSVNRDASKVQQLMGVCPQHDLLWGDLTPVEHLRIFAKFKGVARDRIDFMWERFLHDVKLFDVRHKPARTFSGGMKRRLSVAISLVGDPSIVLLDEPTTGMDPMNRRYVWDMIIKLKKGRVVLLTTHSMEEADALGDHISIMSHGKEVAAGTPLHLKNSLGGGYQVKLVTKPGHVAMVKQEVKRAMPSAKLVDDSAGSLSYTVPPEAVREIPPFFAWVEQEQTQGDHSLFTDWGLSHTTLEEVFIRLARAERAGQAVTTNSIRQMSSRRLTAGNDAHGATGTDAAAVAVDVGANKRGDDKTKAVERAMSRSGSGLAAADATPPWLKQLQQNAKGAKMTDFAQLRGLVRKSAAWHLHETKSLCCQLLCPLILLALVLMLQVLVIDPLQADLAAGDTEQKARMLRECNECKATYLTSCTDHTGQFSWCAGGNTDLRCQAAYCTSPEFATDTLNQCWACREFERRYSGAFLDVIPEYTMPAYNPSRADNINVQVGDENINLSLHTGDWVSRINVVAAAGIDPGKFEGGLLLYNYSGDDLYQWRNNIITLNNPALLQHLNDLSARNRSGFLGHYPLGRFPYHDREYNSQGPYKQDEPWWMRKARFDFDVEQAELRRDNPGTPKQHYSPPGNQWVRNYLMGPDMVQLASTIDADNAIWRAQERVKDGEFPVFAKEDPSVFRTVDELFPQATIELKTLDKSSFTLDVGIQSFFTWISLDKGDYQYCVLKRQGLPDWCQFNPSNDQCQGTTSEVRPEWNTQVDQRLSTINRVLTGLSTAWLRENVNENMTIETGFRPFPYRADESSEWDPEIIINNLLNLLLPLATTFLVPVFTHKIVMEKQMKLRVMMLSSGLRTHVYWLSAFLFDFSFQVILMFLFLCAGLIMQIRFFSRSSFALFAALFAAWCLAAVPWAYLLSTLVNRTKPATIVSYLLLILSVVASMVINGVVFQVSTEAPWYYLIFPPMCYYRGIFLLTQRSYLTEDISADDEFLKVINWLLIDAAICGVLTWYLDAVLAKPFGMRRSPLFCITDLRHCCRRQVAKAKATVPDNVEALDSDVAAEFRRVAEGQYSERAPVQVANLVKEFGGGKVAVNNVSLIIEDRMTFGLLGPNGAGKTTLISTLTGMFAPSQGYARVAGLDIATQMSAIHQVIGICPQFDVHFPTMTVREHLLLYARLKGVPSSTERSLVDAMIEGVGLSGKEDTPSSELSGGMRRRLSFGLALVGNPKVLFLDEPTTGLDPETRRQIWRLVDMCAAGRCVILTTHSMDEADALASRIGIMANGSLRCLGSNLHLKNKFGNGFKLSVTFDPPQHKAVDTFVRSIVPRAQLLHDFAGSLTYQVSKQDLVVSYTFEAMENRPAGLFHDWSIQQTSLEEVFLSIAHAAEAEDAGAAAANA